MDGKKAFGFTGRRDESVTVADPHPKKTISDFTILWIQAISGLLFTTFLILHLANTIVANAGQAAYDSFQRGVRWYYQFPPLEIIVVAGAATVHALAGLVQVKRRITRLIGPDSERIVPPVG